MKTLVTATFVATLLATGSALAAPARSGKWCWTNTDAFGSGYWARCRGAGQSFSMPSAV
jgi:hypothetical protein